MAVTREGRGGWRAGWAATGRGLLAAAAAVLLLLPAGPARGAEPAPEPINYWPFYDERYDPVDRAYTRGGLGPLLFASRAADGETEQAAFRPFYHRTRTSRLDREEVEGLYPLLQYTRTEQDWEFQFLYLLNLREEGSLPTEREARTDLFPFYLSGRTEAGREYRWFFPFGGTVYDRLGRDEIEILLFPLYLRSRGQGVERRFFPWPILGDVRGEGWEGFKLNPLFGYETQAGVLERRYLLWPLFMSERKGLDTDSPEESRVVFPFWMSLRSPARETTTVLWPLFTYTQDRERRFEEWQFPWPLFVVSRGEGRQVNRFLPFFTWERSTLRESMLLREMTSTNLAVLYPLYVRTTDETATSRLVRDRVLWWFYSDARQTGADGEMRRVDIWPLARYLRDREGRVHFQALAPLEPLMPGNELLERNYSPLWALYTYRRSPEGAAVHSLLWNLVRHEETPEGWGLELLGPLLAYREHGAGSRLTLLGGLVSLERDRERRRLTLFGRRVAEWADPPTLVAIRGTEGGDR